MPDEVWRPLQDIFVIAYMFVLRIGVPIMIIWAIGMVIAKIFQGSESDAEAMPATGETAQHCWEAKNCLDRQRIQCPAFQRPDLPCWLALQLNGGQLPEGCFTCALFVPGPKLAARPYGMEPAVIQQVGK